MQVISISKNRGAYASGWRKEVKRVDTHARERARVSGRKENASRVSSCKPRERIQTHARSAMQPQDQHKTPYLELVLSWSFL